MKELGEPTIDAGVPEDRMKEGHYNLCFQSFGYRNRARNLSVVWDMAGEHCLGISEEEVRRGQ